MRSLVANDRHVEGCWTGYSASLDRSVLKKAKYLDEAPRAQTRAEYVPQARAEYVPPAPSAEYIQPTPPPEPQPPKPQHREPPPASPFAEKLQQAWRKES
jgi:hypothetical protein